MEKKKADLRKQADLLRDFLARRSIARSGESYKEQYRAQMVLLFFIVIVGLTILGVPHLRNRLSSRVERLYEAAGPLPFKAPPAWAKVGANPYPFPAELQRPIVPRSQYAGVVDLTYPTYRTEGVSGGGRAGTSEFESGRQELDPVTGSVAPEFRQGKVEQEAYDVLLAANASIANMVKGSNSALQFKTWSAARIEEDAFLVDLTFVQVPDNTELHYTWRVKLLSKQITPLSYHARSLPK